MFIFATNFIFFPSPYRDEPARSWEDIYFNSGNSKVYARYIKADKNKPTIIFSHGNGGNVANYFPIAYDTSEMSGFGFLVYDYRGYGKSKGITCEENVYEDLRNAVKYLNIEKKISNDKIILWGVSIGGAVTAQVATEQKFKGVILQNTFTNIRDMAKEKIIASIFFNTKNHFINKNIYRLVYHLPIFQPFDTKKKIKLIKSPLFIIHSKEDRVIPYTMALTLAEKNPNAQIKIGNYGNHNDFYCTIDTISDYINSL